MHWLRSQLCRRRRFEGGSDIPRPRVPEVSVSGRSMTASVARASRVSSWRRCSRYPRAPPRQLSIVMWGINDLAAFGPSLGGYRAALRLFISRLRTDPAGIHSFRDPALSYSGPRVDSTGERVTDANSSFTWTSPNSFPGGAVAFMMTVHRGVAQGTVSAGRQARRHLLHPTVVTAAASSGPQHPVAYRVAVPPGRHTVRCRITDVRGGANLVGFLVESDRCRWLCSSAARHAKLPRVSS